MQRNEIADLQAAECFVGTAYVPGQYDCAHLFLDVQRQVFGRTVVLPVALVPEHAQGRAHQAAQIRAVRDQLAQPLPAPEHGCAVLLISADAAGHATWHIGTVFLCRQEVWVLHNSAVMGSAALHRLRDFALRGQRLEGFYKWK